MIYIVGAGPGDPELITVRGRKALAAADCIIYAGSLVNPALLDYARADAEIHDSASLTLEQVLAIMLAKEAAGLTTVRLHTGDPSLYGAIREQIDALAAAAISCEIIPGVSSFSAAAAALGAEFTLPGISQSPILTRLEGRTPVPPRESITELARAQTSMAIFLSSGMLAELADKLITGGYASDTPAAIVYKASWPDQRIVRTTLADLPAAGQANQISKTALILVGAFLGQEYERSYLYNPEFTHAFRVGSQPQTDNSSPLGE